MLVWVAFLLKPHQPPGLPHRPQPHHLTLGQGTTCTFCLAQFHPAWSILHRQLDGLCRSDPVPSQFPSGPLFLASSSPRGPSSSQTELLCSLNTPCFPKRPCLCTGCSVNLFPLSFTWVTSTHPSDTTCSGIPSLGPRQGQEPLHSHNALRFSHHSPCLHPLWKGPSAPVQGSTHQGQIQVESLCA